MITHKPKPGDFKPCAEDPKVRKIKATLDRAEARARKAAERVAEAKHLVSRVRDSEIDAAFAGEEPDQETLRRAEEALAEAMHQKSIADGAVEMGKTKLAEAMAAARQDLIERLTKASREAAKELSRAISRAMTANERVTALWARANEFGIGNEVELFAFTGRLTADVVEQWQRELSDAAKPRKPRPDLVAVQFTAAPPQHLLPLVKGNYTVGEMAGFPKAIAARLVREGVAVYADDPTREAPPEPKPAPVKAKPGESVAVRFEKKWFPGLGRQTFMTGDTTRIEASVASGLVADGTVVVVTTDPTADPAPAPAPMPGPAEGRADPPAIQTRGAAQ